MRNHRWLIDIGVRSLLLVGGAASCSFLYDLDRVQCEIPLDCEAAGFDRASALCIDGVCVEGSSDTNGNGNPSSGGSLSGTGGTTSSGGSDTGGSNTTAGGGSSTGGSGGTDGGGSSAGGSDSGGSTSTTTSSNTTTGTAGAPGCSDNEECIDSNDGNPAICRDGDCVSLLHEECPAVLGEGAGLANIKQPRPLIFGAYSSMDPVIPKESAPAVNYEFAINEFNAALGGGLPGGPQQTRRPFVAILCDSDGDVAESMDHLIDTVGVPAIISSLYTKTLLPRFEQQGNPGNVFFMSPLDADSTLTSSLTDPNGLMWHLLAEALELAPAYQPLVARTEALIRAELNIPDPETDPIRVALVVADTNPFLSDLGNYIVGNIVFNGGKSASENGDNFQRINIDSIFDNPNANQTLGPAFTAISNMRPHIVLAMASREFMMNELIQSVENAWPTNGNDRPPFYLLSPYLAGWPQVLSRAQQYETPPSEYSEFVPLRQRMLGVNFAAAEDTALYDFYFENLDSAYDVNFPLAGTENFYDAAYYVMYSFAAAGSVSTIRGNNLADGMQDLLNGADYDVGPSTGQSNPVTAVTILMNGGSITLNGTMGPPDFNTATGARSGRSSIWCVDGDSSSMAFEFDVMDYNGDTMDLEGPEPCDVVGF